MIWTLVSLPVAHTAAQQPAPAQPPVSRIADSVKQRETVTNDSEAVARVDNEPLDPSFKGFLTIPGTTTRIRFGGYVRLDVLHDFQPAGNSDEFIVSSIPIGVITSADNSEVQARQTRINFELRRGVPDKSDIRIFFEVDFFGSSGATTPNLRHAFGQVSNILAGFTTSTIQDPDARPDLLDHEGPPSRIAIRQAQLRYTLPLAHKQSLAFAVETPFSDVPSTVSEGSVTTFNSWPDFIVRYRRDGHHGHVQVGGVLRSIGGFAAEGAAEDQVTGAGLCVSGSLLAWRSDTVVFEASGGRGFARYIKDMSGKDLDVAIDSAGEVRAAAVGGLQVGYEHLWDATLRSTIAAAIDQYENVSGQAGSTYHRATYGSVNLVYKPTPAFSTGIEYTVGRFTVKDGSNGTANRVQGMVQYDFVK